MPQLAFQQREAIGIASPIEEEYAEDGLFDAADLVEEVMESIERSEEGELLNGGSDGDGREVWGDGQREWTGWVQYRKSVERRCLKRSYSVITPECSSAVQQKKIRT
jgi:hypothetical protein